MAAAPSPDDRAMRFDPCKPFGDAGEGLAFGYLFARGYRMRERNWRFGRGEVDLICEDGPFIVFVEVKARRGLRFGLGHEGVDRRKQRQLMALARVYMGRHPDRPCRFDVVSVDLRGRTPTIRHLVAAFP